MAKIIFNEDPNHFLYDRYAAGVRRLEKEHILDFLEQYENTGITDFFICIGSSTPWFETKTRDNVMDTYRRWLKEGKVPFESSEAHFGQLKLLTDFYEREGRTVNSMAEEFSVSWLTMKNFVTTNIKVKPLPPLKTRPERHGHPTYRELEYFQKYGN